MNKHNEDDEHPALFSPEFLPGDLVIVSIPTQETGWSNWQLEFRLFYEERSWRRMTGIGAWMFTEVECKAKVSSSSMGLSHTPWREQLL